MSLCNLFFFKYISVLQQFLKTKKKLKYFLSDPSRYILGLCNNFKPIFTFVHVLFYLKVALSLDIDILKTMPTLLLDHFTVHIFFMICNALCMHCIFQLKCIFIHFCEYFDKLLKNALKIMNTFPGMNGQILVQQSTNTKVHVPFQIEKYYQVQIFLL